MLGAMIGVFPGCAYQFLSLPSESETDCNFYLKPGAT